MNEETEIKEPELSGIPCPCCDKLNGKDDHTCPFKEDVDGDSETMCNCCDICEQQCADDI